MDSMQSDQQQEIFRQAKRAYTGASDWVSFYREVLGLGGIVRRQFPTREMLDDFEQTEVFHKIQRMVTNLREKGPVAACEEEPTQMITVRLPKSLRDALRTEAHEHRTSMNKLCISKLLQFIDDQMIPTGS